MKLAKPKHMFLFGAGASTYSGPCLPENPPLSNDLYRAIETKIQCHSMINEEVKRVFNSDGFEAGFDALWKSAPFCIQSFQRDLAHYFLQFYPLPGNYYIRLVKVIQKKQKQSNIYNFKL